MILKFKSNKEITINGLILEHDDKKCTCRIDTQDLTKTLSYVYNNLDTQGLTKTLSNLYDNGIVKVEIEMEEVDDVYIDKFIKNEEQVKKIKTREFFEEKLKKELEELQKDNNLTKFFNKISFEDKDNIFEKIYERISNLSDDEFQNITGGNSRMKQRIYSIGTIDETNTMKESIKNWIKENYPDYMKYSKSPMTYIEFLRILLKNTGKKYY